MAAVDSAETPAPDDSGSDSFLAETEVKEAIAKHRGLPDEGQAPPLALRRALREGLRRAPRDYVHFGDQVPDSKDFDWQCIHCFGRGGTVVHPGGRSASPSSATSSDAFSGHEEGAEGAASGH